MIYVAIGVAVKAGLTRRQTYRMEGFKVIGAIPMPLTTVNECADRIEAGRLIEACDDIDRILRTAQGRD